MIATARLRPGGECGLSRVQGRARPQTRSRRRPQAITQPERLGRRVQHHPGDEAFLQLVAQERQPSQVSRNGGASGFDLERQDATVADLLPPELARATLERRLSDPEGALTILAQPISTAI